MKRIKYLIPLIALVALCTVGCGEKNYDKFPDKYSLANVDVGGMTVKEAKKALKAAVKDYKIAVTLDDIDFDMKSEDIGLEYNDKADMQALVNSANTGDKLEKKVELFKTNEDADVEEALVAAYIMAYQDKQAKIQQDAGDSSQGEDAAQTDSAAAEAESLGLINPCKASIQYSQEAGCFVGVDGVEGDGPTYTEATENLLTAVENLEEDVKLESVIEHSDGEKAADSQEIKKALESANAYLALQIDCNFAPEGADASTETIPADTIAGWLMVQIDGKSIELDGETMSAYCTELASKHDVTKSRKAKFKTTAGGLIDIRVKSSGQTVDANQLYTDIYTALEKKESATIDAVYTEVVASDDEVMDFGGSYCEVDLTNQMVYVYKNGQQVVASQCVTGCVAEGCATPTGVYKIFSMDRDRYLNGPGYKTWVNFFMPFNGGIGFHDASWRSTFGGNIYLYNGSHGCINMPYSAVKTLYNNVSNGTYVIVYGGVSSVEGLNQAWSGTTSYSVTSGSGFQLDMTCLDNAKMTYESSNPGVAWVNESGYVSTGSAGTAVITVKSEATGKYRESSIQITLTVNEPQASQPSTPQKAKATISVQQNRNVTVGESIYLDVSCDTQLIYSVIGGDGEVTVDTSGKVTGLKAGTVTIKISGVENESYYAPDDVSVTVTVNPAAAPENPDNSSNQEN